VLKRLFQKLRGSQTTALPGYTAIGEIRQSSMSVIFKARHRETGQIVAVKVHKPEARKAVEKLESIYRDFTEGQITAAFEHPNIVRCLDHGKLGPNPYLVLEYLEGVTLQGLLAGDSRRLAGHRVSILCEAASAVAHVHSRRFIHHDVCAKNLFILNNNHVKLIDFGLATPLLNRPAPHSRMGTAEILAPELLRREPCDHRIDVFAWGVTAYELLSGHWPFESPEHHQTLSKILNVRPVPLERRAEGLPEEVTRLVMRCIEKDPGKRLANMNTAAGVMQRHLDAGL
jgi:serine/threonine protein kinase